MNRMKKNHLNIGAYYLHEEFRDEAHIADAAAAGIDFFTYLRRPSKETLDLFYKYQIGAAASGILPHWFGGDGENAGGLAAHLPLDVIDKAAGELADHPAIWGIDIGDEPSALDFPHYGKVFARVAEKFPGRFPYLNLYPNYAMTAENSAGQQKSQLGTATYREYIDRYVENVPSPYICYDFYQYTAGVEKSFENLEIVAAACKKSGRDLWIVLQCNSRDPKIWLSENKLRWQALQALAYGARTIIWACYAKGWWENQILDESGNKTEQYEKLKTVNAELHAIGRELLPYRVVNTRQTGHPALECDAPLLVAELASERGDALFAVNAADPLDQSPAAHELKITVPAKQILTPNGEYSDSALRLPTNTCALIKLK